VDCTARFLPYSETKQFSSLVLDYIDQHKDLTGFYSHFPSADGFKKAVEERKKFKTDRGLLVEAIQQTHAGKALSKLQSTNLEALKQDNTFTICTAHQPNIFSGYLYFIYKTLHAVSLAETLGKQIPDAHFVPVFYIGSEDNDLDELSQINLDGQKLKWETKQTGAVGRMKVDKGLIALVHRIEGRLGVEAHGAAIMDIIKDSYTEGVTIAEATFRLLNHLFAEYGLLILQPDRASLKKQMITIFRDDLNTHLPYHLVERSRTELASSYKVQVNPREINLFYLEDGSRQRILKKDQLFLIDGTNKEFTQDEIMAELDKHPEKFSPNVVLRGIFQETILPNIAFIGGGSETAYWLELKNLFEHYQVPFPVLVLRNSYVLVSDMQETMLQKTGWKVEDLFQSDFELMNRLVKKQTDHILSLDKEISAIKQLYATIRSNATVIDETLEKHVGAIEKRTLAHLENLEKKMLRAEKRKFEAEQRQIEKLKSTLFPNNGLQERVENILPYYAKYGKGIIDCILKHSPAMDMQFGIIRLFDKA
jgi:bacillithiol biosynthesis cysteine-adding enzyme BshC